MTLTNAPTAPNADCTCISSPVVGSYTIAVLSSCSEPWGGSEELWSSAAVQLSDKGNKIRVVKQLVQADHPRIVKLLAAGVEIEDSYDHDKISKVEHYARCLLPKRFLPDFVNPQIRWVRQHLLRIAPDLVVVSQGENFDGLDYLKVCRVVNVPYVIVCQKATDQNWPDDRKRNTMRDLFLSARKVFFVSQHNLNLTELQIGARLPNADIVRNPYLTQVSEPLPWPDTQSNRVRMACVGRLFAQEKGQDVLLKVLAEPKWRARDLEVTFVGDGINAEGLKSMAQMLGLTNVRFAGFTHDIVGVWRDHHALVLPSRCEGLPLSLVEAMFCGRPAIVTNVGGNAEMVDDNRTGFIADSASFSSFDEAMERAWQRRHEWKQIGQLASQVVRRRVQSDPGLDFAEKLMEICR